MAGVQPQLALTPADATAIARDAYIYGFPLVDSYRIQHAYFVDRGDPEFKAPWNQIANTARVFTPEDRAVQTPNSDTPYSMLGADLRAEPLVLSVPEVEDGRYYSAQFVDMYTFNFAYVGSRTTGSAAGRFLLAGPRWRGADPRGVNAVLRCETDFAFVLYRTQLFSPADIEQVKRIQAGYKVQTLSSFLGQPLPAAAPRMEFVRPLTPERQRASLEFFNVLNFVLGSCPTHPSETALMARFARIGVGPGRRVDVEALAPALHKAIEDGISEAWAVEADVAKAIAAGRVPVDVLFGTRDRLKNNYAYRMAAAAGGIYGNSAEEASYRVYYLDAKGENLDTARHRYALRFAPGQLPPVDAFWSVTLYELPSQLLSANPLNRYLINSPMLPDLVRDGDGGLTIHVQHDSPGAAREANWLPAPRGPIKVGLRLYAPRPEASSGAWKAPPMTRVN
jgi:hypothetical protein